MWLHGTVSSLPEAREVLEDGCSSGPRRPHLIWVTRKRYGCGPDVSPRDSNCVEGRGTDYVRFLISGGLLVSNRKPNCLGLSSAIS